MYVLYSYYESLEREPVEVEIGKIYRCREAAVSALDALVVCKSQTLNNIMVETHQNTIDEYCKQITDQESFWYVFVVKKVEVV